MRQPTANLLLVLLSVLGCSSGVASKPSSSSEPVVDGVRLPTGVHLDPAGVSHAVGSFPLAMVASPRKDRVVVLLNGWARTGLQVVDWKTGHVAQTAELPAAFLGLAFSPDGQWLCASGGNTDMIYRFRWTGDTAALLDSIRLAPPTARGRQSGVRYPAEIAFSPDGSKLYVAENLADSLAVLDMATATIRQRVATGRYPYGVVVAPDGSVFVSAWGGDAVRMFSPAGDTLKAAATIPAGRHPSAMVSAAGYHPVGIRPSRRRDARSNTATAFASASAT